VRHPERVSHLILYGGFARAAARKGPEGKEKIKAMATLARSDWGADSPALRQMFATQLLPDAGKTQIDALSELEERAISASSAARYLEAIADLDVADKLGQLRVPTIVLHVRGDVFVPFEAGRKMAEHIPGARFVALEGRNHVLLEDDPASARFFEEVRLFLRR
jgi:pimeloyl-ACP methyl ester carboxylesterase